MTLAVRMSVVPKETRRMIAWNLHRVMQDLAGHGHHSEDVILWGVRRNSEPMKMQVRHVHARIHRTSLAGLGRKIIDVGDLENIPRGSTDHGGDARTVESEGIPAIFVHRMQRQRYNVPVRPYLRRFRQHGSLGPSQSLNQYLCTDEKQDARNLPLFLRQSQ